MESRRFSRPGGGGRVWGHPLILANTCYWLKRADLELALGWRSDATEQHDMTKAAFVEKVALASEPVNGNAESTDITAPAWAVGDVVQLKSGGAPMTVVTAHVLGDPHGDVRLAHAPYSDIKFIVLPSAALEAATPDKDIPF